MAHFVGTMLMADLFRHPRPSAVGEQLEVGFVLGVDPHHALGTSQLHVGCQGSHRLKRAHPAYYARRRGRVPRPPTPWLPGRSGATRWQPAPRAALPEEAPCPGQSPVTAHRLDAGGSDPADDGTREDPGRHLPCGARDVLGLARLGVGDQQVPCLRLERKPLPGRTGKEAENTSRKLDLAKLLPVRSERVS